VWLDIENSFLHRSRISASPLIRTRSAMISSALRLGRALHHFEKDFEWNVIFGQITIVIPLRLRPLVFT
jgi:hypothetical protein